MTEKSPYEQQGAQHSKHYDTCAKAPKREKWKGDLYCSPTGYRLEDPTTSCLGSVNLLERLTEFSYLNHPLTTS